jgi:hypothetical protein
MSDDNIWTDDWDAGEDWSGEQLWFIHDVGKPGNA